MNKLNLVHQVFNSGAELYHEKFKNLDEIEESLRLFEKELICTSAKVLDLGCGPGNITRYLLNYAPTLEITGVDISENMLKIARVINPEASFFKIEALTYLKTSQPYNGIMCGFILPYLDKDQVEELIALSSEKLNESGVLYLSTMEGLYSESKLQGPSSGIGPKLFLHFHEEAYLLNMLHKNHFEVIYTHEKKYEFTKEIINTDLILIAKKV